MEQPLKVMVIDDSRTIRRTAQMLLGEAGCEVRWKRLLEGHALAARQPERQPGRVQELTIAHRTLPTVETDVAVVERVAGNRMPDEGEMNANLVRAPGLQIEIEQRCAAHPAQEVAIEAALQHIGHAAHPKRHCRHCSMVAPLKIVVLPSHTLRSTTQHERN